MQKIGKIKIMFYPVVTVDMSQYIWSIAGLGSSSPVASLSNGS
jgi:hypothetical protein